MTGQDYDEDDLRYMDEFGDVHRHLLRPPIGKAKRKVKWFKNRLKRTRCAWRGDPMVVGLRVDGIDCIVPEGRKFLSFDRSHNPLIGPTEGKWGHVERVTISHNAMRRATKPDEEL